MARLTIDRRGVNRALKRWVSLTGKSAPKAINLAAKLWVSFAYAQTTTASPERIRSRLLQKSAGAGSRRRRGGARSVFAGTLAARIIAARVKRGELAAFGTPQEFYRYERRFVSARVRSAGYHRSGFIPALREFRARGSRKRGGRRREPLRGKAKKAPARAKLRRDIKATFENSADNFVAVQGDVVDRQAPSVERQLRKFLQQDLRENIRKTRLN